MILDGKCMDYEAYDVRPRGRPKKTRRKVGERLLDPTTKQGEWNGP